MITAAHFVTKMMKQSNRKCSLAETANNTFNTPVFGAGPMATLMLATVTGNVGTPADETTAGTDTTGGLVRVTWAVCPAWA